jgi:arylsulfatase A-like enzyme
MHIDILPTVLAAAGRELTNNLDGENLLPFLFGERSEPPRAIQTPFFIAQFPEKINHICNRGRDKIDSVQAG